MMQESRLTNFQQRELDKAIKSKKATSTEYYCKCTL